jgi:hypothetical protein
MVVVLLGAFEHSLPPQWPNQINFTRQNKGLVTLLTLRGRILQRSSIPRSIPSPCTEYFAAHALKQEWISSASFGDSELERLIVVTVLGSLFICHRNFPLSSSFSSSTTGRY